MKILAIATTLLLVFGMTACENNKPSTSKQTSQSKKQAAPYPGKPTAPVQMQFELTSTPEAGVPLAVNITLLPGIDADSLLVSYTTTDSLVVGDNVAEFSFTNVKADQAIQQTISVIPQSEGAHYIYLQVQLTANHPRAGTRSFAIPVRLGDADSKQPLPANTKLEQTPEGEQLIIKKARETYE